MKCLNIIPERIFQFDIQPAFTSLLSIIVDNIMIKSTDQVLDLQLMILDRLINGVSEENDKKIIYNSNYSDIYISSINEIVSYDDEEEIDVPLAVETENSMIFHQVLFAIVTSFENSSNLTNTEGLSIWERIIHFVLKNSKKEVFNMKQLWAYIAKNPDNMLAVEFTTRISSKYQNRFNNKFHSSITCVSDLFTIKK